MQNYEKPIILANNELSEGVYAASGGNDALKASVVITGNDNRDTCYFSGKVENNTGERVENWSVQLAFSGPITGAEVYNCKVSYSGNVLTITPAYDWNRTIEANASYNIDGKVTGSTVLSLA